MSESPWTTTPDPQRDVVLDTRTLRALAHPVRVTLLRLLRSNGPSTATRLAEELGLNSGATSYHLRQLANAGLLIEDERRGTGRDRWWRAAHRSSFYDTGVDPGTPDDGERQVGTAYLNAIASAYAERLQRAAQDLATLPDEWRRGVNLSDFRLRLTPEEVDSMLQEVFAVIARYRRDDGLGADQATDVVPEGARPIVLQVQSFPIVEAAPPATA